MYRIVIALLLWLVAIATAHAQWRQLPGQVPGDSLLTLATKLDLGLDLGPLPVVAMLVRTPRL